MDRKDLLILAHLRQNGRKKLTKISKETGIPVSTLYDRMEVLHRQAIKHYACLVDFVKIGFPIRAVVVLKTNKKQRDELKEFLSRHTYVNTVWKINNSYDILIEVLFSDFKPFEEFLLQLQDDYGVQKYEVFHLIEDFKQEGFFSDPTLLPSSPVPVQQVP